MRIYWTGIKFEYLNLCSMVVQVLIHKNFIYEPVTSIPSKRISNIFHVIVMIFVIKRQLRKKICF